MAKLEGTSRTFGQLIVLGDSGNPLISNLNNNIANNNSQDVVVQYKSSEGIDLSTIDKTAVIVHAGIFNNNGPVVSNKQNDQDPVLSIIDDVLGFSDPIPANVINNVTVLGSSVNSSTEIKNALLEAVKIDNLTTIKSLESEKIDLNFLQQPDLNSVKLIYNFFNEKETDILNQEDLSQDPLLNLKPLDVPMYVELQWDTISAKEPLSDSEKIPELVAAKRSIFYNSRGVISDKKISFKTDPSKKLKDFSSLKKDGLFTEIVDIFSPELAFNATQNSRAFKNTVFSVINIRGNRSVNNLPLVNDKNTQFENEANTNRIQINFTVDGLKKVLSSADHNSDDLQQIELFASVLDSLNKDNLEPVGFISIPELLGIEYVGYIVDKERFIKSTGQWVKIHEFKLVGAESDTYRDTRVAYGEVYRYRLRSVAKVTLGLKKTSFDENRFRSSIEAAITSIAQQQIDQNIDTISNTQVAGIQAKTSIGQQPISSVSVPGAEIQTTADFIKIIPQKGVSSNTLTDNSIQKNAVKDINLLIGQLDKEQLRQIFNTVANNFITENIDYKSFYYESELGSSWKYIFIEENQPPDPPSNVLIIPNSLDKKVFITWLNPSSEQRDILFVNLYRRLSLGLEWQLLGSFSKEINIYEDIDVIENQQYIYALSSVDVHGLESFLSSQVQVQLNPRILVEKQEKDLLLISGPGLTLQQVNDVSGKYVNLSDVFIAKSNIKIKPSLMFSDLSKNFLIRVTSLDNGEIKEFKVNLKNQTVSEHAITVK